MYIQSVSLNACLCVRNTISLCQGESAGILSSNNRWNIREKVSLVLLITQHVDRERECLCVRVRECVWYVFCWTKSIRLSHCYIVTWFTLYVNVNSHCNKSFCYENTQVVHNHLSHALKFGVWCAASFRKVRGSCFFFIKSEFLPLHSVNFGCVLERFNRSRRNVRLLYAGKCYDP